MDDTVDREPLAALVAGSKARPFGGWRTLPLSAGLHVIALSTLATLGAREAVPSPEPNQSPVGIFFLAPPPPPAPLPLGSREVGSLEHIRPATRDEKSTSTALVAPLDFPQPDEAPLEPEPGVPESIAAGSPNGSPFGIPEGMEEGVDGGVPGGLPDGIPGGIIGGTGTRPVADFDRPPRLVRQTQPVYPRDAFVQRVEGEVLLEILIDVTGRVTSTRVLHSIASLDAAAIHTVHEWRFEPALRRGHPVPVLAWAPVRFSIY